MHPFSNDSADLPQGVSPHLEVRLKPGWRFDRRRGALLSETGEQLPLRDLLPPGVRIVPMVPALANADPKTLSVDEQLLARSLQVGLPSDTDSTELATVLRGLAGVELVATPPQIGLP
jgi:hypothetical protein